MENIDRIIRGHLPSLEQSDVSDVWLNDIRCISYLVRVFEKRGISFDKERAINFLNERFYYNNFADTFFWLTPNPLIEFFDKIEKEGIGDQEKDQIIELYSDLQYSSYRFAVYLLPALKVLSQYHFGICLRVLIRKIEDVAKDQFFLKEKAPAWQLADTLNSLFESGLGFDANEAMKEGLSWATKQTQKTGKMKWLPSQAAKPKSDTDGTSILLTSLYRSKIEGYNEIEDEIGNWLLSEANTLLENYKEKKLGKISRSFCRIVWAFSNAPEEKKSKYEECSNKLLAAISGLSGKWKRALANKEIRPSEYCELLFLLNETYHNLSSFG